MAKSHKLADGRYECQNCLKKFTKNEYTFIEPIFCSDPCRKQFNAMGGMSLKRIETQVRKWVRVGRRLEVFCRIESRARRKPPGGWSKACAV